MARPRKDAVYNADSETIRMFLARGRLIDNHIAAGRTAISRLNLAAPRQGVHPGCLSFLRSLARLTPAKRAELIRLMRGYLDIAEHELKEE
jgi:hypothetical protein